MIPSFEQRHGPGGRACPHFGGGGGSSSSSNTTTNIDRRLAVGDGGAGITGDHNILQITDAGIVSRALDTVDRTQAGAINGNRDLLAAIGVANATNADGFGKLLEASTNIFNRGESLIGQTQKSVADAYTTAHETKAGTIDNKTIIVLAVAGAAAIVMGKRGRA